MTEPRISIVVPSFEQGAFLEESLRSILDQQWPDLELVVVDGGSRDRTVEILESMDEHISFWVSEPDRGQSDAINKGLARCTGDIVTFFGSDDLYLPGCFADLARLYHESPEAGAYIGAFRFMDEHSRPEPHVHPPRYELEGAADLALADPACWRLHQVATFYNREVLDRAGRWVREEMHYVMDRELLYRVCRLAPPALSQRTWAQFRRHADSKSVSAIPRFSAELASLHLLDLSSDEPTSQQRQRHRLAQHHLMRGHVKMAAANGPGLAAVHSLVRALWVMPSLLAHRSYARSWARALGLVPARGAAR